MANFAADYGIIPQTSNINDNKPNLFDFNNVPKNNPTIQTQPNDNINNNPNIIQGFLDKSKTMPQFAKNRDTVIKMLKNQEDEAFIKDFIQNKIKFTWKQNINDLPYTQEVKQRIKNIGKDLGNRYWEVLASRTRQHSNNPFISAAQSVWTKLKTEWNKLWALYDVVWEWIWLITPDFIKNWLSDAWKTIWDNTPDTIKNIAVSAIKEWWQAYHNFKQQNPFLADAIEWSLDIASIAPIGKGAGIVGKTIKTTWETINKTKWVLKASAKQIESGLTKEQIKWFQSNPYQAAEFKNLSKRLNSPEWISDIKDYKVERVWAITKELTNKIDNLRANKWESSKAYADIRKLPTQVNTNKLLTDFKSTLESHWMKFNENGDLIRVAWSKAKDLNQADLSKFNQLYNDIKADAKKWYLTADEILTFRKTASDLSKYDANATTTWQNIMRSIRKNIDTTAKDQLPWLKGLDKHFVDKLDSFENAVKDLVYKSWNVKGEWRSNIVNIIWTLDRANRAKLLSRLDEVMPWIWEKIQAIDNIPTILKSLNSKWIFEKYTWVWWAVAWASTLSAIPIAWPAIWAILWFAWWKALEKWITAIRKNALEKILSKVSKEWQKRLVDINTKMLKNRLLQKSDKEFLDNLKAKFKNEINKNGLLKNNNRINNTSKSLTPLSNNSNSNNLIKKIKPKALPLGRKNPIITPQTKEKAIIAESKKELSKAKIGTTKTNTKPVKKLSKSTKVVVKKELPKTPKVIKNPSIVSLLKKDPKYAQWQVTNHLDTGVFLRYISEVNWLKKWEAITPKMIKEFTDKYWPFNKYVKNLKDYIEWTTSGKYPWWSKLSVPRLQKIVDAIWNKKIIKKSINNKAWFINPSAIARDIAKLPKITSKNIDLIASKIVKGINIAKEYLPKAKAIVRRYLVKHWNNLKNKVWDLLNEMANKIPWVKSNLLWWKWAKLAPIKWLAEAKALDWKYNPDVIWKKTGWEKWADWKWKFEIDDTNSKIKTNILKLEKENIQDINKIKNQYNLSDNDFDALYNWEYIWLKSLEKLGKEKVIENIKRSWKSIKKELYDQYGQKKVKYEIQESTIADKIGKKLIKDIEKTKHKTLKLWQVLQHNNLYKQYPELKDITVNIRSDLDGYEASYNSATKNIDINMASLGKKELRGTLLHEIQHYIQDKELFAKWWNIKDIIYIGDKILSNNFDMMTRLWKTLDKNLVDEFWSKKGKIGWYNEWTEWYKKAKIDFNNFLKNNKEIQEYANLDKEYTRIQKIITSKPSFEQYQALAWEVEARNIQNRLEMNIKDRIRPWRTETTKLTWTWNKKFLIKRNEQLVRFDDTGKSLRR